MYLMLAARRSRQTAQARVPVPHSFDALGQSRNYFTSRAPSVIGGEVWWFFTELLLLLSCLSEVRMNPAQRTSEGESKHPEALSFALIVSGSSTETLIVLS